mgnify:CR=1 FL=1
MGSMSRRAILAVLVGSLGYFVDIYDLVLFSIVRVASLKALGVPDSELLNVGVTLLNCQMTGMLIGGVVWGVLGDKRGRLSVLFGSIFLYSAANIANGFVTSVDAYAVLRFIAGLGLAGELGAAITLVSETLSKESRGFGTAIVAGVGLSGAVAAGLTADLMPWNYSYIVGGTLGLCLLALRVGLLESGMYLTVSQSNVRKGDLGLLLGSRERFTKYIACILIGVPIWFLVGVIITFSPEISKELGIVGDIQVGKGILFTYAGVAVGDLASGFMSQWIRSRKKVVWIFMGAEAVLVAALLMSHGLTSDQFYALCVAMGFATGFWAVFVTIAAEQFGTNLRATVATSVPNFVRGSVVPMTLLFRWFSEQTSLVVGAGLVGILCLVLAVIALWSLHETYGKDLNYLEVP